MFKNVKRILAAVLASAMVLSTGVSALAATASPGTTETPAYEDNETGAVKVTESDAAEAFTHVEGVATISKIKKTTKTTFTTPATVTFKGIKYTVVGIRNGLFKDATKAKTIVLGKSIINLRPWAFCQLPKTVKTIKIKATKFKAINWSAFHGLKKAQTSKITVIINKKMDDASFKKLEKAFKKAGFKKIKRG